MQFPNLCFLCKRFQELSLLFQNKNHILDALAADFLSFLCILGFMLLELLVCFQLLELPLMLKV
ncbi:MAG: hypothetical protein CVV52_12980 [Spirochaetae bacterium HGW-Spirochaetae-8]|nr:MAG: hypothetical protein CVV52_12980 [Spirochaetae bacterium HGW-Spirochaetae-8]